MADLSNGKDGGDSIDTSVDGIRKTVEGALAVKRTGSAAPAANALNNINAINNILFFIYL